MSETEVDVEHIAAEVRAAHDQAERQLELLRTERERINAEIKLVLLKLRQISRLNRAVTPRSQNGPDE